MSTSKNIYESGVEMLRAHKRGQKVVNTWFLVQEIKMGLIEAMKARGAAVETPDGQAELLRGLAAAIPIDLPPGSVFAGTQDVAFSPSYALINPAFKVETFAGYCDPCAIYDDVVETPEITAARIDKVRAYYEADPYTTSLRSHYRAFETETSEVAFFMEPVTGHTIPDLRPFLEKGVDALAAAVPEPQGYGRSMAAALRAAEILANRYRELARVRLQSEKDADERQRLAELAARLERVPRLGARTLPEAIQSFILLWECMVLEQAPNPYAFSAGNLDRVFEPYMAGTSFEDAVAFFRHLLAFYIVGSRGWAISQNIMAGGSDASRRDLTGAATRALLEAFVQSNDPQPSLSVKIHPGTPDAFFAEIGRFFAVPGHSTPSLFNDDAMFAMLKTCGIPDDLLADYAIAGCQEPLIMGRSSLNTTNTWLNLGKVLELALNDGRSMLSEKQIGPSWADLGYASRDAAYGDLEAAFLKTLDHFLPLMEKAGNGCTTILGVHKPVPFTSALHDGFATGRDLRDPVRPGVRFNGSGCLIHGLAVVADSFAAVREALPVFGSQKILDALKADFAGFEDVRQFLLGVPKYGNALPDSDAIVVRLVHEVSRRVNALRNPAGNRYLADYSTPSTHLLYGHWVAATPDGRHARSMLNYGVDPLPESVKTQLPARLVSLRRLPYIEMNGGYASHIGIPHPGSEIADTAAFMRDRVIRPLFAPTASGGIAPFYVYFNLDSTAHLREILRDPAKYAPSGVYIMRIHGTFVNFLDLSPAIQEDIIHRLEGAA